MGWTSVNVQVKYKNGKAYIDRKEECDKLYNQPMVTMESSEPIGKYEVIKSSVVSGTYYAAVKKTKFAEPDKAEIFAAVCLTSTKMNDTYNFFYKDMDETCNPFKYDCPVGILNLLSPTDNKYALEWRKECRKKAAQKNNPNALSNLPIGSIVKFKAPFDMRHNKKGDDMVVKKMQVGNVTRWVKDGYYYPSKVIGHEYEVLRRGR